MGSVINLVTRTAPSHLEMKPTTRVVLVPGHRLEPGDHPSSFLIDRLRETVHLYLSRSPSHIILSGSITQAGQGRSEASVMQEVLRDFGVDWSALYCDHQSRDTIENARYSLDWLRHVYERASDRQFLVFVVTQSWHMPRMIHQLRRHAEKLGDTRFVFKPHPVRSQTPLGLRFKEELKNLYDVIDPDLKVARRFKPLYTPV